MKCLAAFAVLSFFVTPALAQSPSAGHDVEHPEGSAAAIVYSEGGAFLIAGPEGWTTDHEVGERLGVCCVYYPAGTTWDTAETVMYPNIATKGPGQRTLKEFMDYDLAGFREHNPRMTYTDGEDIPLRGARTAKLRYFFGVNKNSSEAVAYIDEEKIVAMVVLSSRTRKGLNDSMLRLRAALRTYSYMDVRFANKAKSGKEQTPQLPKD